MCKTYLTWHLHDKTSSNDLKQPHMTSNFELLKEIPEMILAPFWGHPRLLEGIYAKVRYFWPQIDLKQPLN